MKRAAGLACLLLCAVAGAVAAAAPAQARSGNDRKPGEKDFTFAVIAHTFPGESGDEDLKRTIERADKEKPAFVVAAGIKSAGEPCSDKLYLQRRALLNKSDQPLILVLTGADWTQCRNSAGRSNAIERLNRIREIYFDGHDTLGARKFDLNRQSAIPKFRSYAENGYWEMKGVLFATVNLPARNNHYLIEAGRNSEYEDRLVANRAWLQRLFSLAKRRKLAGLVLFSDGDVRAHVEQGFSLLEGFSTKHDGFAEPRRLIRTLAEKYPGKVLLVDANREPAAKGEAPAGTVTWRGNVGHVTLAGEWNEIRVMPDGEPLFTLNADEKEAHGQPRPPVENGRTKPPAVQGK
ncbi:hypothetical protein IP92_02644 [Pseudoduganella flava]|uniref:Transmembrane protein n=1 Tax=Pseudoduganella flava TaxID=871742 RepID=A0A562PT15_9BURK|nr:hypothetical protein [Pseudoduganella flava]TWI47584.1 hypothetical protein IP92_02644 [Pseudoduganella flava]